VLQILNTSIIHSFRNISQGCKGFHFPGSNLSQYCKLPLCNAHVTLYQKAKDTKDHSLAPIDQVSKHQQHDSFEYKETEKAQEESVHMASNRQPLSNAFETQTCFICYNQLSKTVEATNGHGHLFCSEQCLEHYNSNHGLYLSLIPEEVIDHIMIPLLYTKVLHYLKCADSKWRTKIENMLKILCQCSNS